MSKSDKIKKELRERRRLRRAEVKKEVTDSADTEILYRFTFNLDSENRDRCGVIAVTEEWIFRGIESADSEKKSPAVVERFRISDYREFKLCRNVGSVSLEAVGDETVELCRSDMTEAGVLSEAARAISGIAADPKGGYKPSTSQRGACPKCGKPYPGGSKTCPHCTRTSSMIVRLFGMVKKDLPLLLSAFFFFAVLSFVRLLNPILQKKLVDEYITVTEPREQLLTGIIVICLSMLLLSMFYKVVEILRTNMLSYVNMKLMKKLRSMLFDKIQALSVSAISKRTAGELIRRVTGDTSTVSNFFVNNLPQIVEHTLVILILGTAMFVYDWKLALLVLVPAPVIMAAVRKVWRYTHRLYHRQWNMESQSNTVLHDVFQGIRVVKVFGMEQKEIKRYDEVIKKVADISEKNEITWAMIIPYMTYLVGIGNYVVLAYVGSRILGGSMTLGDMTMFTFFTGQIYTAFDWLSRLPRQLVQMITSTRKIFDIIDEEADVKDSENAVDCKIEGNVEFRDVTFGYDDGEDVLSGVSFTVKKGEMIGIVGRSGVGKSTLINLIMRLYDVRSGDILIDGMSIKDMSQHSLRSQIGVVLQETFLFSGTIYDNLSYADPSADREAVIRAAKMAGAHKFIMKLPDGYNTRVGERGNTLSGGEKQRIAIARAILRNPKILILDEATSALDTETERIIQDSVASLIKDRTTFAIAHRLSTLRNATRLIVLDKGKIAEMGTHEELMKKEGIYYGLVLAQRKMSSIPNKE